MEKEKFKNEVSKILRDVALGAPIEKAAEAIVEGSIEVAKDMLAERDTEDYVSAIKKLAEKKNLTAEVTIEYK